MGIFYRLREMFWKLSVFGRLIRNRRDLP